MPEKLGRNGGPQHRRAWGSIKGLLKPLAGRPVLLDFVKKPALYPEVELFFVGAKINALNIIMRMKQFT